MSTEPDELLESNRAEETGDTETSGSARLAARIEVLERENRRLRREYRAARRTRYRRAAVALVVVGLVGLAGGYVFPTGRTILWALGGTGVFAGVLTRYLTPERFVAATFSEQIYGSLADNEHEVVAALGLQETEVYVPVPDEDGSPGQPKVWLFVPQMGEYEIPPTEALGDVFVVTDDPAQRGVSFRPTGWPLFTEFERALATDLSSDPQRVTDQLADGVVEQLELADGIDPDVDVDAGRITVGVVDDAYGPVDRFDHPIVSFFAVGLATGLEQPITVETVVPESDREELITLAWEVESRDD